VSESGGSGAGGSGAQGPLWGSGTSQEQPADAGPRSSPPATPGTPAPTPGPAAPSAPMWGPDSAAPAGPTQPPAQPPPSAAAPPPTPAGPPPSGGMWGAGGQPPPPPVQSSGIPGCLKAAIILGVIAIVALVLFAFVLTRLVGDFLGGAGGIDGLVDGNGGSTDEACSLLTDDEARQVLGGNADAIELSGGLYDMTIGLVIDNRVLPDAPDCWITEGERAYIARVARSDGNSAAVYAQEKQNAQPTSEDQGGGVTLENPGYFGGDVAGLGDEAFCTGISPTIMAGVVVRQGDSVVYATVGPPEEGAVVPNMGTEGDVVTAPDLCLLAQDLARKVLE
jgi:hypothetical protein